MLFLIWIPDEGKISHKNFPSWLSHKFYFGFTIFDPKISSREFEIGVAVFSYGRDSGAQPAYQGFLPFLSSLATGSRD